jgi:ligand-binding sensor domain-containing protein/signal transduction histidine kinase/AraC-like DNA-binding protein/AmiR/NasT family two-component response regulator
MFRSIKVLLTLFLFLIVGFVSAQLSFDRLSVGSGLSQSTVLSIVKDSRGYIWFGTVDRLNRYNGREFKIYNNNASKSSISSDDYIYTLLEDKQHNLWIGTSNGLNRYIPENDSFERIVFNPKDKNSINDNITIAMCTGNKGRIWFGTITGLGMLESSDSRTFKKFFKQDGLADNQVSAVYEDRKRNVWVGTTGGLTRMSPEKGQYRFTTFTYNKDNPNSISSNSIKAIAEDKNGRIWIGTETEGLNLFVPENASFIRFKHNPLSSEGLSNNRIRKILATKNGQLWIGTMNGLNILDPDKLHFTVLHNDPDNRKSLSNNSIKDIYEDNQGSIWIGTMFGGVSVVHPNSLSFTTYRYSKYKNSISSDIICAIAGDSNQNLWIGTEGYGLNYFNKKTNTFKHYTNDPRDPASLNSNTVKAIFKDNKGQVWVGLYEGALELFNPNTGKFKHYPYDPTNPKTISYGYVRCITEDKKGRVWVGTSSMGLNLFDPDTQIFTRYTDEPSSALRLSNNYIQTVYVDSKNNLWVGTADGLNLLAAGSNKFKIFYKNTSGKRSSVNCIREDHSGNIWIGTYRDGLSLFNPKQSSFTKYNKAKGLVSNNVIDILEDNEGYLWLSTDQGLSKFDVHKKTFKTYNMLDGLPANQFNTNSAYKDNKGNLYFGSYGGLVTFTPKDIKENTHVPPVVFSGLKLFNQEISVGGKDGLLPQDINFTKEITFSASQNIFSVEFAALNYIKPGRNKYAYKLQGFEKNWNYVNNPIATYTNLPSGHYTLLVKGSNNDGYWNNMPSKLAIRVLPPLWLTWWAYMCYAIISVGILYFINRFFRRQERLKTDLYYEQLNNEKQQELYQMKLDFFTRISHELRTPLTLIYGPLEKLIDVTQMNQGLNKQLQNMKVNTDRLLRLITELLDFRKIETGNLVLQVREYDLVEFSHNIFNAFSNQAAIQHIDYVFNSSEEHLPVFFDATQMEKILFNILSNAFKYTPNEGKITLSIRSEAHKVEVIIADNGVGIPYTDQRKIFTSFYRAKGNGNQPEGWGIGLALVKNLVDLHKGGISLHSIPSSPEQNGATSFTVCLLKGKDHFRDEELAPEALEIAQYLNEPQQKISGLSISEESEIIPSAEKKYTIMVVEDNAELRGFIAETLEDTYTVLKCVNGMEGWETAIAQIPDLIVSDVTMPEMSGLELCSKLKNEDRTNHIPVIMLTAMASHTHQVNGIEAGADIYITKPFSTQILGLNVRNLLTSREAMKEKYSKQVMLMPKKVNIESPDEKFLDKLMTIVEENMENADFNVSFVVDEIGMSQTVLYKKIKALTGLSIVDFIKSVRLKRAAQLLAENKLRVSEIAYRVGFNNRKYFSQEFRKQFGKSPSEYVQTPED